MDRFEDPLSKISRQLSELAAVSNEPVAGASPDLSRQWTQFSGITPQTDQTPFRNLCSWNPMDLPDFRPLSQPVTASSDSNPNHFSVDSGGFNGCSDFLNQSQFNDWRRMNSSHQKFHIAGDLAGRLVDVSRNRVHSCSSFDHQNHSNLGQDNFPFSTVFHCDGGGSGSNVPIHRQMSQPLTHNPFVGRDRSARHSLSSMNILPNTVITEGVLPNDVTLTNNAATEGLVHSVQSLSHMHQLNTSPVFNPSTPPPVFSHDKHSSENFQQMTGNFSSTSKGDRNYSQMPEKININLDLGTTIDKTGQSHFSGVDNTVTSAEGPRLCDLSNKQWHSFHLNKMLSSDNVPTSHTQRQELHSEPTVSADSSKPSYSDIAKTPKNVAVFGTKADQCHTEGSVRNILVKTLKKDEKPLHLSVKRTPSGSNFLPRGCQGDEADQPRVTPSSKYGLDSFGDQLLGSSYHRSSSENLSKPIRNTRGSGYSVGSSVNALDDIASPVVTDHISSENVFDPIQSISSAHKQPFPSTNPAKPQLSSKPPSASPQPVSKETLFFDPRRIFQCKSTDKNLAQTQNSALGKPKGTTAANLDDFGTTSNSDTILNNGKPTSSTISSKLPSSARQHDYINNDLRDSSKLTNQTAAESSQGTNGGKAEEQHEQKEVRVGKRSGVRTNGMHFHNKRSTSGGDKGFEEIQEDGSNFQQQEPGLWLDIDREKIEEIWSLICQKLNYWGNLFVTLLLNFFIYTLGIIFFIASGTIHLLLLLIGKLWALVKSKLYRDYFNTRDGTGWTSNDNLRRQVGLEENINLPSTGEEAMKRLLACKGKDPYSILGLRADSADEDVKKYYKKQAFLVHPDKNQELGAEEAFKILGHAFEMIGEPAKRKQYDEHTQETNEAEAMREFAEMLSKLQTKIQEAANIMHCDNCGGKHRRVPVERPSYNARFCQRCDTRHPAKEGDVWAESTMLGFYWHYFAVMEGHVFNITEWMKCHAEFLNHIEANSHVVMFKIATDGSRRNKHHQQREPNLKNFIDQLFKSSTAADGHRSPWGTHPGTENSWAQGGTSAASAAAAAAKKSRRKKKRH